MEEIAIVRRRSRVWPIVLAILLLVVIALAAIWLTGNRPSSDIGWNEVIELGRRNFSGTT